MKIEWQMGNCGLIRFANNKRGKVCQVKLVRQMKKNLL